MSNDATMRPVLVACDGMRDEDAVWGYADGTRWNGFHEVWLSAKALKMMRFEDGAPLVEQTTDPSLRFVGEDLVDQYEGEENPSHVYQARDMPGHYDKGAMVPHYQMAGWTTHIVELQTT